jgi:hypothetical protein
MCRCSGRPSAHSIGFLGAEEDEHAAEHRRQEHGLSDNIIGLPAMINLPGRTTRTTHRRLSGGMNWKPTSDVYEHAVRILISLTKLLCSSTSLSMYRIHVAMREHDTSAEN